MNPHDAQASLGNIRRLQDRTHDELVHQGFSPTSGLIVAVGLFALGASTDLPRPWNAFVCVLVGALMVGTAVVARRRTSVHRSTTALEVVFFMGMTAVIWMVFGAFRIAAWALDIPAPGTAGAAGMTLVFLATMPLTRRVYRAVVRQGKTFG